MALTQKTTMATTKSADESQGWFVVDGDNQIVGRLATKIATVLMGKHKPTYTPHILSGDVVVVVNAERVRFTGQPGRHDTHPYFTAKMDQRTYASYSGYPSGLKVKTASDLLARAPERILQEAVRRMLPKNKLGRQMLKNLKLYIGSDHPHQAQQPAAFPETV